MKRPEIVEVEWLDAYADNEWKSVAAAKRAKPVQCFSIGHLLAHTEASVIVAPNWQDGGMVDYTIIPAGCVVAIRKMGVAMANED